MSKPTAPAPELFDTIEYLPLFAGLPVPVVDQAPTSERPDPSGPVDTWGWAGRLDEETPTAPHISHSIAESVAYVAAWLEA